MICSARGPPRCSARIPATNVPSGTRPRFRLLDTTRVCALAKLDESGERERIARRHAEYYRDLFEHAEREVPARPPGEWPDDRALEIDNLRAAHTWAFGPHGNSATAVGLADDYGLAWSITTPVPVPEATSASLFLTAMTFLFLLRTRPSFPKAPATSAHISGRSRRAATDVSKY